MSTVLVETMAHWANGIDLDAPSLNVPIHREAVVGNTPQKVLYVWRAGTVPYSVPIEASLAVDDQELDVEFICRFHCEDSLWFKKPGVEVFHPFPERYCQDLLCINWPKDVLYKSFIPTAGHGINKL